MIPKIQAQYEALKKEVLAGNLAAVLTRYGDLMLVVAVACMVGLMIVPLPTWLLDLLLTVNITAAVTVLMVSIYISNATQIASYPTLLLITTLYRLSLDISATRLILLQADAGEVIHSFGNFVVQGNFVVGAVIFLIITLVQFIVITKGAERVAKVAARHAGRHARQADEHRRRPSGRHHRLSTGSLPARRFGQGIPVLRRHGWRDEVRQG
jgi:type III secretion protein V